MRRVIGRAPRVRRIVGMVLTLAALLTVGSTAWAYWTSSGTGGGTATTATLNPPTNVVASFTPGLISVGVTWSAPTAGLAPLGYYVIRTRQSDGVSAPACGSSPTALVTSPCTDTSVAPGSYRYTATSVYRSWSATSASSSTVTVVADVTKPVVTVTTVNGGPATSPMRTNASVASFGGACGATAGDVAVVTPLVDGVATASVACTSGSWTVTLSPSLSSDMTVPLSASQGDLTGNIGTAPALSVTIDKTRPTVLSIARVGAPSVKALPVSWTVTFSKPVSGVAVSNFALSPTGLSGPAPSVGSVSPATGPPSTTWTVTTTTTAATAASGQIRLDLTNGATIVDATGNTLSNAPFLGETYAYDTVGPTVSNVTSPLVNGSYKAGQVIPVTVRFSEQVTVTGAPLLALATGTPTATPVAYSSGSGSDTLTFTYTVAANNTSADLNYPNVNSLTLGTGQAIVDAAGNAAVLTLPNTGAANSLGGNKDLVIDTAVPVVIGVSSTRPNGSIRAGQVIPVTVTFSEPVTVTGIPQLVLATGSPAATRVNYTSGSGGAVLTFDYTVAAGNTSPDLNYEATTSLILNGGAIADAATNAATLTLPGLAAAGSLGANKDLVIDTTDPVVAITTVNTVVRTFPYSSNVDVTTIGGTCSTAVAAGDATTVTVQVSGFGAVSRPCNAGTGAWSLVTSLTVNGSWTVSATQGDAAGNLGLAAVRTVVVDKTPPTVSGVSSPLADGSYRSGQVVPVTVTFREPVVVTGAPRLTLSTGSPATTVAGYSTGSGTDTLTFLYTVGATNTSPDLDYVNSGSLTLGPGGAIADVATNAATLTLPNPAAAGSLGANKALVIDNARPTVSGVSSPLADGSYRAGQVIPVTVTFNEPVNVTGTPRLTLSTGPSATTAVDYTSGSGSSTLTFEYTVADGNTSADLDYAAVNSLTLNGGTINDLAGNAATLTLPAPGATGSLGNSKVLVIDTTDPVVTVTSIQRLFPIIYLPVRASGTAEVGAGPVTVYLCFNVGPPCDSGTATQIFTNVAVDAAGAWQTAWTTQWNQGTWYASATQTDAAENLGTSAVFGPYTS